MRDAVKFFQVVEKAIAPGRRNFVFVGGLWHQDLEGSRRAAALLSPYSLAHRMFIVTTSGDPKGGKTTVVEEVELAPLGERLSLAQLSYTARRSPVSLAAESTRIARRAQLALKFGFDTPRERAFTPERQATPTASQKDF